MKKKTTCLLLALAMLLCLTAGCAGTQAEAPPSPAASEETAQSPSPAQAPAASTPAEETQAAQPPSETPAEEAPAQTAEETETPSGDFDVLSVLESVDTTQNPIQFPLAEMETVTAWMSIPDSLMQDLPGGMENHSSNVEMEKLTNVHVEWTQVTATLAATQFNLMIAGGEYLDMLVNAAGMYTTGMDAAVDDEVYLPLNDYLETYAPRYWAIINGNKDIYDSVTTDSGRQVQMFGFTDKLKAAESGFVVRQDFLDAVGMEAPVTYDDYYDVLTAFKTELNIAEPIYVPAAVVYSGQYLVAGYGIAGKLYSVPMTADPWYQVDGQVRYGVVQDEYLDFLTMMNKWYSEGLFDKDFVSNNKYDCDTNIAVTDDVGLLFLEGMAMKSFEAKERANPDYQLTAIGDPVMNAGDVIHFDSIKSWVSGGGIVLTTGCKNPALCVAWLDNWFSGQGIVIANYGTQDESYYYGDDGKIYYTDLALEGNNLNVKYTNTTVPTIKYRDSDRYSWTDFRTYATDTWSVIPRDSLYTLPSITLTQEESEEYARLISDIHTYAEEHINKFVMGEEALDQFGEFRDTINSMGLDRCIEIYQAALDRYYGK